MTTKQAAKRSHWSSALRGIGACPEAVQWATTQPSYRTAWKRCERGGWMLWLVGTVSGGVPESDERKQLVAAAVACARLALPIFEARYPNDRRVRNCLDIAERWTRGEATIAEVRTARAAVYAAAAAAYDAAAYAAAYADAAAYAADADAAAYAADAAAAYAADAAAARTAIQKQCADLVRQHYPTAPTLRGR